MGAWPRIIRVLFVALPVPAVVIRRRRFVLQRAARRTFEYQTVELLTSNCHHHCVSSLIPVCPTSRKFSADSSKHVRLDHESIPSDPPFSRTLTVGWSHGFYPASPHNFRLIFDEPTADSESSYIICARYPIDGNLFAYTAKTTYNCRVFNKLIINTLFN